jgi:hypothetical protein
VIRSLLKARDVPVGMRVRRENEIRGLLKTFGVTFGKRVGGFMRRAEEERTLGPARSREADMTKLDTGDQRNAWAHKPEQGLKTIANGWPSLTIF